MFGYLLAYILYVYVLWIRICPAADDRIDAARAAKAARVMASAMATTPDVVIHRYSLRGVHDVFQGMCSLDQSVPFIS